MSSPFLNRVLVGFIAFMLAVNIGIMVIGVIVLGYRDVRLTHSGG